MCVKSRYHKHSKHSINIYLKQKRKGGIKNMTKIIYLLKLKEKTVAIEANFFVSGKGFE